MTRRRSMSFWSIALLGMTFGCSNNSPTTVHCPPSRYRSSPPLVIAHAGGEGLGPANTLVAMRRSMAAGADILDADLRMTSDGVIVARHDRDLATTTNGSGNVDDTSWADLQRLDAASEWTGDAIAEDVRVPSLAQILAEFPDTTLSVEIKQHAPSLAQPLCDLLESTKAIGRVYVSANDDRDVYAVQAACPVVTITTTYRDVAAMRIARENDTNWCAPAPIGQPPFSARLLDRDQVDWSHDHGMAIFTWTVDDPETLRGLADAGVDAVYTRRPDIARRVFDEWSTAAETHR